MHDLLLLLLLLLLLIMICLFCWQHAIMSSFGVAGWWVWSMRVADCMMFV